MHCPSPPACHVSTPGPLYMLSPVPGTQPWLTQSLHCCHSAVLKLSPLFLQCNPGEALHWKLLTLPFSREGPGLDFHLPASRSGPCCFPPGVGPQMWLPSPFPANSPARSQFPCQPVSPRAIVILAQQGDRGALAEGGQALAEPAGTSPNPRAPLPGHG